MKEIAPIVRNVILQQSFLVVPDVETIIKIFEVPEGWYFELHSINIASTIFYDRTIANKDITGDLSFLLADASKKIIPSVVLLPTASNVDFSPPLRFEREVNLLLASYIKVFTTKKIPFMPQVLPPELENLPLAPFPFRIEVKINGILKTRWMG